MPIVKGTLIFRGEEHGWTESLWTQNAVGIGDPTVYDKFLQLAILRSAMLGRECGIKAIRISDENALYDSYLRSRDLPGSSTEDADEPDVSLNVVCREYSRGRKKRIFMRGLYDSIVVQHGRFTSAPGGFEAKYQSWRSYLINNGFGWMGINPTLKQVGQIQGYVVQAGGQIVFTTTAAFWAVGDVGKKISVRLSGVNGRSNLNGAMILVPESTTTARTVDRIAALPFVGGGQITQNTKEFILIIGVDVERVGVRRVGAPLLVSAGRASNRVKG